MPYRTLAHKRSGKEIGAEVVREYAPARRTITIGNGRAFSLQMPYIIFLLENHTLYVAFSIKPIKSLKDTVYCATLGNVYPYWGVCGCDAWSIEEAIERFWNYRFTMDGEAGPRALKLVFGSYREWAIIESVKEVLKAIKKNSGNKQTFKDFLLTQRPSNIKERYKLSLSSKYPKDDSIKKLKKRRKKEGGVREKVEVYEPDYDYDYDDYDDR